jgi:hypothetical protein
MRPRPGAAEQDAGRPNSASRPAPAVQGCSAARRLSPARRAGRPVRPASSNDNQRASGAGGGIRCEHAPDADAFADARRQSEYGTERRPGWRGFGHTVPRVVVRSTASPRAAGCSVGRQPSQHCLASGHGRLAARSGMPKMGHIGDHVRLERVSRSMNLQALPYRRLCHRASQPQAQRPCLSIKTP